MDGSAHRRRVSGRLAVGGTMVLAALGMAGSPVAAAAPVDPGFAHSTVSTTLAGGEPFVSYVPSAGTGGPDYVYTSHEGTTHLFRNGVEDYNTVCDPTAVTQPSGFVCSYDNQVNVWTSTAPLAGPSSWTQTTVGHNLTGQNFSTNPVNPTSPFGSGFSDPDLTIDEGGYLYDTGINLATDSVFASTDGGRSFLIGNNNCHGGDRPWLAGGVSGEVFLATDTTADVNTQFSSGHEIFRGVVTGAAGAQTLLCYGTGDPANTPDITGSTSTGIADYGTSHAAAGGQYSAAGKLFYDHNTIAGDPYHGALIDPAVFANGGGTGGSGAGGVGISILPNAAQAFAAGTAAFPQQYVVPVNTGIFAHWPSIAVDSNDVVYVTWDTTEMIQGKLNNTIQLATIDLKSAHPAFSAPITITHPHRTVLWPWVAVSSDPAGAGNAAVVWYQYDGDTNPDTGTGDVTLMERTVLGAASATPTLQSIVDAVGTPIHSGGICQGGTLCVATGGDRRLGDFFTDAIDQNGCVLIASAETSIVNPNTAISHPLYVQQTSGSSLTGSTCAVPASGAVPESRWAALLLVTGVVGAAVMLGRRRSRRVA